MEIDSDAFSSGQILSKIWLADTLENVLNYRKITHPLKILSLGGWYNVLHFILRCRNKIKIEHYRSLDLDKNSCDVSEKINESWVWQNWKFKSIHDDANDYLYQTSDYDCVINTSVEHFYINTWFENIPKNAIVILQSNNMNHEDHVNKHTSLEDLRQKYEMSEIFYQGEKLFQYDNSSFNRFMIIGKK